MKRGEEELVVFPSTSDTPRTDVFVKQHLRPFIMPSGMRDDVRLEVATEVRRLMIDWATFARELEQDLNDSTPREWKR